MSWNLTLRATRSADSPPLAVAWPSAEVGAAGAITENRTYWWHLTGDFGSPFTVTLRVNGITLARDVASEKELWFSWQLGFNAGFADLEISGLGEKAREFRLVVDPAASKLVRRDFRLMLRDIAADTQSLASTSGLREGLARGTKNLPIAKVEFIIESTKLLSTLVHDLDSNYRRRLDRVTVDVPLRRTRGVSSLQWNRSRSSARPVSAHLQSKLPPELALLIAKGGGVLPDRVAQQRPITSSKRVEHGEILGLIHSTLADLRRAERRLGLGTAAQGELVLRDRCKKAARALTVLLELSVFVGLEPIYGRWQHSHLYERAEPYRSIHRLYRDLRSGIGEVDGSFAQVPLRETFRLYETWVTLRLARAAASIDSSLDASSMFEDALASNGLVFTLQPSSVEFLGNRIKFKPVYNEVWKSTNGIGSYSRQMIPDIVLELNETHAEGRVGIVLDAKYRVDSELNDAIASIHMYKDALVEDADLSGASNDRRIISVGLVVVPNLPGDMTTHGSWRSEKMPTVIFREGYQERFRLGALVLRPGMDVQSVAHALLGLTRTT